MKHASSRCRPNILLITTDQQRFDHLGLAGVRGITTPNLDRLGTDGAHFNRAYTSCPICTPARLSLLTGQFPSVHRGYSIGVSVDPFPRPTIADLFSRAGYSTALVGKGHTTNRIPGMHYRVRLEEQGVEPADWFPDMRDGHDHSAAGLWNIPPNTMIPGGSPISPNRGFVVMATGRGSPGQATRIRMNLLCVPIRGSLR